MLVVEDALVVEATGVVYDVVGTALLDEDEDEVVVAADLVAVVLTGFVLNADGSMRYTFNLFDPPQTSELLPLHAMSHPVRCGTKPAAAAGSTVSRPQKHSGPDC